MGGMEGSFEGLIDRLASANAWFDGQARLCPILGSNLWVQEMAGSPQCNELNTKTTAGGIGGGVPGVGMTGSPQSIIDEDRCGKLRDHSVEGK
jgi:hypothetical protein